MNVNVIRVRRTWLVAISLCLPLAAMGATYPLESDEVEVVGEIRYEHARRADTLMDIARWTNMGYREMRQANPGVDLWKPGEGTRVLIPSLYILPEGPREGIVLNRAEKRIYYYHDHPETGQRQVTTHPVGIGRAGRETPLGSTHVVRKLDNPAWYPTEGVLADYRSRGIELPRVVPPGPDNPLGDHALVLDLDGYLIHGTNRPDGVGMRVSQGCVRLYPEHIERLMHEVAIGTPVHFIDQPVKVGSRAGHLYLEIHPASDGLLPNRSNIVAAVHAAIAHVEGGLEGRVDWQRVHGALENANGVARRITTRTPETVPEPERNARYPWRPPLLKAMENQSVD